MTSKKENELALKWTREAIAAERELLSNPGVTIQETLVFNKMSVDDFAIRMGITSTVAVQLIIGARPITDQVAAKLEEVLGIDKQFWINREASYVEKLKMIVRAEEVLLNKKR